MGPTPPLRAGFTALSLSFLLYETVALGPTVEA